MSRLSGPEIAEIRARLDARSPGDWIACVYSDSPTLGETFAVIAGLPQVYRDKSNGLKPADARFIAHAPVDVERLLAELVQTTHERVTLFAYVQTLEAEVARLEDALSWGSQGPPDPVPASTSGTSQPRERVTTPGEGGKDE